MRKCAKFWESMKNVEKEHRKLWKYAQIWKVQAEKVWKSAAKVHKVWESVLQAGKKLFSVLTISQLVFVQMLEVTFS